MSVRALLLALLLSLACLMGIGLLFLQAGFYLETPQNKPTDSDLIVILGGGLGERAVAGATLYKNKYAPIIFLTGMDDILSQKSPIEDAYFRLDYLLRQGIPTSAILIDRTAKSTWDEAIILHKVVREAHYSKVLVVTDAPHLKRVSWVLSHVFKDTEVEWRLIATDSVWWHPCCWWENTRATKFVFYEIAKLIYYGARYLLP